MKKLLSIVSSLILVSTVTAHAEWGIGISGSMMTIDGDGTETTAKSGEVNNGSHSEDVEVPEVFIELLGDNGGALGVSFIPTRDMGSKSRTDAESPGDTDSDDGTYKAAAELNNVLKVYSDVPMGSYAGVTPYLTLGIQHVELVTLESLNSGATYPNEHLFGFTVGLGFKGDLPGTGSLYYKGEVTYTDFETYEASGAGNKVSADLDATAARLSIGYKF